MGFIPKDAHWYLADVVLEFRIAGETLNVIHINTHLVKADSPNEAYQKSIALGQSQELEYENTDGRQVRVKFHGLRELTVIHEPLEDGAELTYTEYLGVSEERWREWILPKDRLGVFAPISPKCQNPNYMPESIMQMLEVAEFNRKNSAAGVQTDTTPKPDQI